MYGQLDDRLPIYEVADDWIVNKLGDVCIGLEVEKPEIFTLGENDYDNLHLAFVKAIRVLPAGTVLHVQDIYRRGKYKATALRADAEFLDRASEQFFKGRQFLRHRCRMYLIRRPAGRLKVTSASSGILRKTLVPADTLDEKICREFESAVRQFCHILEDSKLIRSRRLRTEELVSSSKKAGVIEQSCYLLEEDETPVIRDIGLQDRVCIGDKEVVTYTLGDAERLPGQCSTWVPYEPYSTERTRYPVSFAAGLGLLLPFDHIYNQYIVVEDVAATMKRLESRRLQLQSLSRYSRENLLARDAVNVFLTEAITQGYRPVRFCANVMAWTEEPGQLAEINHKIGAAMAAMDATAHQETVGAPQLWWASVPGNGGDIPDNECCDIFLEQAACFLGMESNYADLGKEYGIRLGDRLTGKPVMVDIDIEPRHRGWTGNGNLFVLSGSGGGKSFLMAHLCRTYHAQGMHIVLVDVGRSYETLCRLLGGVYKTYEEDAPIAFNPFYIEKGQQPDIEKKESIKALVLALWKRADEDHYRSEYVTISDALAAYYMMVADKPEVFPCFDSFYEYMEGDYCRHLRSRGVRDTVFDIDNFLYVLRPYYRGGEFDFLLNAREDLDLLSRRFIVFELKNIVGHPILFTVVTMVIVEVFMAKVRTLRGTRKMIVIEEAWKAIASAGMADEIRGWVKTLRKHMGKLALVSQELEDIVDSPIIKQAVINSSDCKILLDQSKFSNRFAEIQAMLGLTDKQKTEVLSINKGHDPGRPYKDCWIGLGPSWSRVYRLETSEEEYLAYTSDEGDKLKIEEYEHRHGGLQEGIEKLADELRTGRG
ncbi:MAG TPA: TraG family conjugative transposon ATPase [Puia sp.]|jgi:conjugation system TraG family ATPase|nr:TraG family conjugative transposon ATPase [Puia sp.]